MAEYRSGYGKSAYGSYNYGLDGSILVAASQVTSASSATSSGLRVREGAGTALAAASATSSAMRVRESGATSLPALSGSAQAQVTIIVAVSLDAVSTFVATCNRVQFDSASISITNSATCNMIEKWEPEPNTPETWTPVDPATEIWHTASNAPTNWTAPSP